MFVLKKKYKELESKLNFANKVVAGHMESIKDLKHVTDELKYQKGILKEKIKKHEDKELFYNKKISDMDRDNERLTDTILKLQDDAINAESYAVSLEEDVQSVKMEYDLICKELYSLEDVKSEIELKNSELSTKLAAAYTEIDTLKENLDKMGFAWNNVNRTLWCNEESKKRLVQLVDEMNCDKNISRSYVKSFISDILHYMGGYKPFMYIGADKLKESEEANV